MNANPQTCPNCGSPVMPGMKFCESCGAKIEALPACPHCGAALAPDVKFCETCGAPVKTTKEGAVPVAASVSPGAETAPIQESPPPAEPPVKETPTQVAAVAATAAPESESAPVKEVMPPAEPPVKETPAQDAAVAATGAPESEPAPVKEVMLPAEPPVTTEGKPVPAVEEKPAPAPVRVKEPQKTEKIKEMPKEPGMKTPLPKQTMIIAGVIILAVLGAAVFFMVLPMLSGSGAPLQNPPASPVTTNFGSGSSGIPLTTPVTSQAMAVSFAPGPTQIPPSNLEVVLDAERDPITSVVSVTFKGGKGQFGVREIQVTLTRSDGSSETKSFKPTTLGSGVTIQGTPRTDRVEATAYFYNGEQYRIIDQIFEYKKRSG